MKQAGAILAVFLWLALLAATNAQPPEAEELPPDLVGETEPAILSDAITSFDWRDYAGNDWVTPVKNQGMCGSCWAFAVIGGIESIMKIRANIMGADVDLSEQYLVSTCFEGSDCCGGSPDHALKYCKEEGVPDEGCMPYVDGLPGGCYCVDETNPDNPCPYCTWKCTDRQCSDRCGDWQGRLSFITDFDKGAPASIKKLKADLRLYGPQITLMAVMSEPTGYVDGDIMRCLDEFDQSSYYTNHAVLIVGYDDKGGYWIVKNSWGTGYGDNGYWKVGYDECNIGEYAFIPDVPVPCGTTITKDTVLFQDIGGCSGDGLVIAEEKTVLDCAGHHISGTPGSNSGSGVKIVSSGAVVKNCDISDFENGILIASGADRSTIIGNTLLQNKHSAVCDADMNYFKNNQIGGLQYGLLMSGKSNKIWLNSFGLSEVTAYENAGATGNQWYIGLNGNSWADFNPMHEGYPYEYVIAGPEAGVDYHPSGEFINQPYAFSPPPYTTFAFEDIELKWKPAPDTNPTKYWLKLVNIDEPGILPTGEIDVGLSTSYLLESDKFELAVPDGKFHWHVASEIDGQKYWDYASIDKMSGAELSYPQDGQAISAAPNLRWKAVPGAINYILKLNGYLPDDKPFYLPMNAWETCYTADMACYAVPDNIFEVLESGKTYTWSISGTALGEELSPQDQETYSKLSYGEPHTFKKV